MTQKIESLTFEQSMQELETLVRRLEEGRMPLEESIKAYERGTTLKNHCQSKLQEAKLKVDQIVLAPNGEATLKPFDSDS
jgi:exodeoxyribonuclease VII small subunit